MKTNIGFRALSVTSKIRGIYTKVTLDVLLPCMASVVGPLTPIHYDKGVGTDRYIKISNTKNNIKINNKIFNPSNNIKSNISINQSINALYSGIFHPYTNYVITQLCDKKAKQTSMHVHYSIRLQCWRNGEVYILITANNVL